MRREQDGIIAKDLTMTFMSARPFPSLFVERPFRPKLKDKNKMVKKTKIYEALPWLNAQT